jgi:hypothetical protein
MTKMNADAHADSLARILRKLGEAGATQEIVDLFENRNA